MRNSYLLVQDEILIGEGFTADHCNPSRWRKLLTIRLLS